MNNTRRKKLAALQDSLREILQKLHNLLEEEEEYRDNMPENMQDSIKHDEADSYCENLEYACDSIDESCDYIDECLN